ncbi:MAG: dihydroneopterin aldolase [Candidatus Eiseniibacteriota bacterium]|nr:MAG: dihydroneopterin aldolase [Candidatus Eisenbacteria bacterium]
MDKLRLTGLSFFGHHGVLEAERQLGQRLELDVELHGDFSRCASQDSLREALDYTKAYELVKDVVEQRTFELLEALAHAVAEELLGRLPVNSVVVRVRKPNVPFSASLSNVEVEIERSRKK